MEAIKAFALKKSKSRTELKLLLAGDEPVAVYYFESGWNYGYPTYHVIIEYGDMDQTDNLFMSRQEFMDKFGVDPVDETAPDQSEYNF
jgi:hypothetical protein